jgi:NADH-quinone oxidoreductase subunit K
MPFNLLLILSGALVALGICGALCRRNLLSIFLCLHIAFLGIVLFISIFWINQADTNGASIALALILLFSLQMMFLAGLIIFIYRNLGTLHIDEMRQLRG